MRQSSKLTQTEKLYKRLKADLYKFNSTTNANRQFVGNLKSLMQEVGHHLQVEALRKTGTERDLFARSAYNRYYYAVFLTVRSMFYEFDPKWARIPHKSYPDFLKGRITKNLKYAKSRANRNEDWGLITKLESGFRAAAALANLMEKANAARLVADYEPTEFVDFTSAARFSLKNIDITEAHDWGGAVRIWTHSIQEAWRQANV